MGSTTVYLALGSNLGDRAANLANAILHLAPHVDVEQTSSIYETDPAYVNDQPRFLNMVLRGSTRVAPEQLLQALKTIEQHLGRQTTIRYGPRLIDLDILTYDSVRIDTPTLTLPHPRIAERAFVLIPLAEIAPELRLPGYHQSVAALAERDNMRGQIVRIVSQLGSAG
ncbi:MAG: 2-amino-4-hydroxy-6-hydroxymethyldihydropteridine diphosphokinase [Herpetosiphon sp.]